MGQNTSFRILPEGGLSIPTADFKAKNVFADQGVLGGISFDVLFGKFGVGLFGGINNNGIDYQDGLPPIGGLIISKPNNITRDSWKQLLVGLGPMYNTRLTKKLDLEFSLKVGFSKFKFPDYAEMIQTGAPLNQQYLMYETRNQDVKKGLDFAAIPGMRLSFKPSEKVAISLGANYTSAMGVEHSYTFLDGDFNPEMSDEQLAAELRNEPNVTNLYKCTFSTIGITLGVGYTFGGGKEKPKDDPKNDKIMDPPEPQYPPDGAIITPEEADSLVLEWVKETPNVAKANYNLWLYEVRDTTKESDSLIFQTKIIRDTLLDLPDDVQLRTGGLYRWGVQSIESDELKPCPGNCYSFKVTFKVGIPVDVELQRQLDGGYYVVPDGVLRLKYDEEYIDTDGKLTYNIYNDKHEIVAMNTSMPVASRPPVVPGDNRYVLNVRSCTFSNLTPYGYLGNGYYVLEVINEKNEKWYLRFKHELTGKPNCLQISTTKK